MGQTLFTKQITLADYPAATTQALLLTPSQGEGFTKVNIEAVYAGCVVAGNDADITAFQSMTEAGLAFAADITTADAFKYVFGTMGADEKIADNDIDYEGGFLKVNFVVPATPGVGTLSVSVRFHNEPTIIVNT